MQYASLHSHPTSNGDPVLIVRMYACPPNGLSDLLPSGRRTSGNVVGSVVPAGVFAHAQIDDTQRFVLACRRRRGGEESSGEEAGGAEVEGDAADYACRWSAVERADRYRKRTRDGDGQA